MGCSEHVSRWRRLVLLVVEVGAAICLQLPKTPKVRDKLSRRAKECGKLWIASEALPIRLRKVRKICKTPKIHLKKAWISIYRSIHFHLNQFRDAKKEKNSQDEQNSLLRWVNDREGLNVVDIYISRGSKEFSTYWLELRDRLWDSDKSMSACVFGLYGPARRFSLSLPLALSISLSPFYSLWRSRSTSQPEEE